MSALPEPIIKGAGVMHRNTRRRRWAGSRAAGIAHRLAQHTTLPRRETFARSLAPRRALLTVIGVTLTLLALTATPALAAPEWGITVENHNAYGAQRASCPGGVESLPGEPDCGVDPFTGSGTTFDQESGFNEYKITVTNKGATETSGPVSVVDSLPPGLVLGAKEEAKEVFGTGWSCKVVAGAQAAECTQSTPLAAGASYPTLTLHVYVKPEAANPSTNVVAVSGGGAVGAAKSDPTVIQPAVAFGISQFTTSVVESVGNPFTQAVGRPFAASTELILNYTPNSTGTLDTAGGGAKDVSVELPAGFIGDPQALPQCPLPLLKGNKCPPTTAIGYTQVEPGGAEIVSGRPRLFETPTSSNTSLVYNLAPPPGRAAEFGFVYLSGIPLTLTASVRSNGDYGVTVEAAGIANVQKLQAVKLTFCENGATKIASPLSYHCNAVAPGATGFLTNPAKCSSEAPTTTVRATPWNEPADEVSKTVYNGLNLVGGQPSETESFVTGCANTELASSFDASSIELSPETTRANAPTGIGFDLKVPQTTEATELATPELRNAMVTLPAGMAVSPSAADGLQACSDAQFGLGSTVEPAVPGSCPEGSQVGTVEVFTPLLSGEPKAEGTPKAGEKLTCAQGTWNGSPDVSYQWLRNGVAIAGATGREYLVVAADEGKSLQCQVTATNSGGSSVAVSREAVVAPEPGTAPPLPPSTLGAPTGTASTGNVLTCGTGTWTGSPTFAYQWLRDGVAIVGATSSEYKLTGEDEGKAMQCQVTGTNAGGAVVADSAAAVSPAPLTASPLLGAPLQGKVFLGEPECSPCTATDAEQGRVFRLFLEVEDLSAGVIVKIPGSVSVNPSTGQLTATFKENPQLPFEDLKLEFKGGPQAPLATPQACGTATTTSVLTPWSNEPGINETEGTPNTTPTSSFNVDWDGVGGACPSSIPFGPSFLAQAASSTAGQYSPLSVSFGRPVPAHESEERDEQDFAGITVNTPPGLLGKIAGVTQCPEAQADAGTCSSASAIGTTTVAAGAGSHPFYLGGTVYLTGPYRGAPFGLSIVVPAKAGPFTLAGTNGQGDVVVRVAIGVNPSTAALTVTSDPLPQIVDGVPLRLHSVRVDVNRPDFMLNPTSCAAQQVTASIAGEPVESGEAAKTVSASSQFSAGGCAGLPFAPSFSASTQAATSKADGASLDVNVAQKAGEANIKQVDVQVPKVLPARLSTLQQACTESQFATNPAGCPAGSDVGSAIATTPLLNSPLVGPAYFVSHGGAAFPDLEVVLQGEGVTIVLDGATDIKGGVTYSRFDTVPDAPISAFALSLPEGPHSILTANEPPCSAKGLVLGVTITGQNGAQTKQTVPIGVKGCTPVAPAKASVRITKAKVSGSTLRVSVKTTAKGRLSLSGTGLKTTKRTTTRAGTYTLRTVLTKSERSKLKHRKRLRLKVRVGYAPSTGASSSLSTTVTFR